MDCFGVCSRIGFAQALLELAGICTCDRCHLRMAVRGIIAGGWAVKERGIFSSKHYLLFTNY